MYLNVDDIRVNDLLDNSYWNVNALNLLFGPNWNSPIISHGKINNKEDNHWIWFPISKDNKLSSNIYKFLNCNIAEDQEWYVWANIWKLNVAPRAKTFVWLLKQNKIKTYEYLYKLNLGPPDPCVFCGLVLESSDHLFRLCHISTKIWKMVECLANIKINLVDLLSRGQWIDFYVYGNSKFVAFIIAVTLWQIHKCRCNCIFRQESPDILKISNFIVHHVQEFSTSSNNFKMQNYLMQNRPKQGFMGIFWQLPGIQLWVKVV